MTITNGTFETDLSGWTVGAWVSWDSGKAILNGAACSGILPSISQRFLIDDIILSFDWETSNNVCCAPRAIPIFIFELIIHDTIDTTVISEMFPINVPGTTGGTIIKDVSQYLGKEATLQFRAIDHYCLSQAYYTLTIDNVILSPNWGTFRISTTPGIANIFLDDSFVNITPDTGSIDLTNITPGSRTVTLKKTDYYDYIQTVDILPGRIYEMSIMLQPQVGCLTFYTDPVGAEIFLSDRNGQVLNDTGLTTFTQICDLFFGDYKWKLIKPGYMPESGTANIIDEEGVTITKTLIPIDVGCIYFETDPPGARIILDGNDTGKVTPDAICNLSLGQHCYRLILPGYIEISDCVTLVSTHGEAISATLSSCPTVTLSADTTSASIGDIIALTANVQPITQQYPVTFKINGTQVGTCNTSNGVCSVNWDTAGLPAGTYTVIAEVGPYGYQTLQQSCTSTPIMITLVEPCVLIDISSNKTSAFIGDTIIFTTNTQPSAQAYIIELRDQDNNLIGSCTTSGGTCPINWDTTGLTPGSYTMTAKVQGQVQCISTPITITLSELVQAGFGGVGMVLIAGLIVGAIYMTTRK